MNIKTNLLLAGFYSFLVTGFGFWWADNFHDYTHSKGDESFFEIEFIGVVTIIAAVLFKIINRKVPWLFITVIPFLTGMLSIFVTLFMPSSGLVRGTTLDNLRTYGVTHTFLALVIFLYLLRKNKQGFFRSNLI